MIKGQHAMNATPSMMIEDANKTLDDGDAYLLFEGVKENGTPYAAWITSTEIKSALTGASKISVMHAKPNTQASPDKK